MKAPVISISIGRFDVDKAAAIEEKLRESRARLESGIMNGNIAYYVGIDRANNAMHNTSIWESIADANQMARFATLALGREFTTLGVHFERPISNCEALWQLDAP
jgi:hypothetical protein